MIRNFHSPRHRFCPNAFLIRIISVQDSSKIISLIIVCFAGLENDHLRFILYFLIQIRSGGAQLQHRVSKRTNFIVI